MSRRKYGNDKFFQKISHTATTGVVGDAEYDIKGENNLRAVSTFASSGTLTVQGRIEGSDTWDDLGTLASGGDSDTFDISTYDFVRFNFTVASGSSGEIAASGFFSGGSSGGGASNAFTIIQPDAGTSPQAESVTDTLTLTSSDGSVTITGNSTTDTIDFTGAGASPAGSDGEIQFNNSGSFGADSELYWDSTNKRLAIDSNTVIDDFTIGNHQNSKNRSFRIQRNAGIYSQIFLNSSNVEFRFSRSLVLSGMGASRDIYMRPSSTNTVAITSTQASFFNAYTLPTSTRFYIKGAGTSTDYTFRVADSGGTDNFMVRDDGNIIMPSLPTSATGLPTGALWNNSGVINIA